MMTLEEFKNKFKDLDKSKDGWLKVSPGIYIQTAEDIIADQKEWVETDGSKDTDFTGCKYWITFENGVAPEGFDTIEEFLKECGFLFEDNSWPSD